MVGKPVQYNWDKSIRGGTFNNQNLAYLIAGSTNLDIDAFVVALPMPMLFRLQMNLSEKISIIEISLLYTWGDLGTHERACIAGVSGPYGRRLLI